MPHMLGHWYDVSCTWCGSSLRVRGPRPCRDLDPTPVAQLGLCPACGKTGQPGAWWTVPSFDLEITSPEHLQQLIDQGHQDALTFGVTP